MASTLRLAEAISSHYWVNSSILFTLNVGHFS